MESGYMDTSKLVAITPNVPRLLFLEIEHVIWEPMER